MVEQNYNKAYEAYQQAVYRDARNPTFWCSIGVLYYQINQYRDALDAYSRAIRLNPYISEVWYDLGTLYESCNNQIQDALDAYQRASELDPSNPHIRQRLELLRKSNPQSAPVTTPVPQDVNNPYQYNTNANHHSQYPPPPPLVSGPQQGMQSSSSPNTSSQNPRTTTTSTPQQHRLMDPPRDLPLPAANNDRRSPVPYNSPNHHTSSSSHNADVRIPDIGSGGARAPAPSERILMNPMMESRSPIYRNATTTVAVVNNPKMPSVVRSPIPTKSSPRMYYNARPNETPVFPPFTTTNTTTEPLRRTSVLYDSEKTSTPPPPHHPPPSVVKREYGGPQLPPVNNHQRHSSTSSNSSRPQQQLPQQQQKQSPVESSAADTLMSMSQKGYVNKKRLLEMADDEEEEEEKRPRLDNRIMDSPPEKSIPVSS